MIQAAAWAALRLFDVPLNEALSFSMLFHASQFVPVTVWGLILLFVEHVSLSEARRSHQDAARLDGQLAHPGAP